MRRLFKEDEMAKRNLCANFIHSRHGYSLQPDLVRQVLYFLPKDKILCASTRGVVGELEQFQEP